jgi:hypothetical protein
MAAANQAAVVYVHDSMTNSREATGLKSHDKYVELVDKFQWRESFGRMGTSDTTSPR